MVEVTKKEIKVKINLKFKNGKELTLGEAEAKELYEKLNELFGEKTVYPIIYRYPYVEWYPTWPHPYTAPDTNPYWTVINGTGNVTDATAITSITYTCSLGND